MAAAQIWTLIALLAAYFAMFVDMRRMGDRMNDGFGELRKEMTDGFGDLRKDVSELRGDLGELRGEVAILRHEVHDHFTRDH